MNLSKDLTHFNPSHQTQAARTRAEDDVENRKKPSPKLKDQLVKALNVQSQDLLKFKQKYNLFGKE